MTKHHAGWYLTFVIVVAVLLLAGCPAHKDVPCIADSNCNLDEGGVCRLTSTGNRWCSYPDLTCPGGYRYSDFDVEPMFSGVCVESHTLTVQIGGSGTGSVSSDPAGITCSAGTCTGEFLAGTQVALSQHTATGFFLGWTYGCRDRGTCTVVMERDQVVGSLFGIAGEGLWVKQLGGMGREAGSAIAIDSEDNIIVAGSFTGTITPLPGMSLTSRGSNDVLVAKLSSATGAVLWAKQFGGTLNDGTTLDLITNELGIYVTGTFQGVTDFGNGPVQAKGESVFVVKLDTNGGLDWSRTLDGTSYSAGVAAHGAAVVVAGGFSNSMIVDARTLTSAGDQDIFVLKMSASTGATIWVKSLGGTSGDGANSVAIDSMDHVVVTGAFKGTVDFGNGPRMTGGEFLNNMFLVKLAADDGAHLLSKTFGGNNFAFGQEVTVDPADNILVAGSFSGTVDFDCIDRPTTTASSAIVLVKYTQAGACQWVKAFGLPNTFHQIGAIMVNSAYDVTAVGSFCGTISFGGPPLTSASGAGANCTLTDVFVARFSGDGTHLNSIRAGGAGSEHSGGITQSPDRRLYMAGSFQGFAEFGGEALSSDGDSDAFIVGLAPL